MYARFIVRSTGGVNQSWRSMTGRPVSDTNEDEAWNRRIEATGFEEDRTRPDDKPG